MGDEGRSPFRYRADVLEELWRHGVQPTERTPPALVREFVRDLYRYEIRRLRARLLRKEFPKRNMPDASWSCVGITVSSPCTPSSGRSHRDRINASAAGGQ